MSTSDSIHALRAANPRAKPGFARSVEEAADIVRSRIAAADDAPLDLPAARRRIRPPSAGAGLSAPRSRAARSRRSPR